MNPEILLGHQLLGFLGLLPAPCCWHPNFQWDFTMEGPGFGPGDNGPMYAFYPNSGYSWLRGGKGQVLEGGVRTPSMAWWPGMILANQEPVDLLHITVPWRLFGTWKSWGNSWNTWGFEPKNGEKHQMCLIVFRISRHISHSCSTFFFSKCSQVFAIAHMIFFHMFIFSFANVTQFYPPFFHFITFHPPCFRQGSLHHRRAAGWRTGRYSRRSSGRWSGSTAAALAGRGPWTEKKDLFLQCLGGEMWWGFFLCFFLDYNYKWWWLILMNGIFHGFHLGGFLSHGPKTHWFQYFR